MGCCGKAKTVLKTGRQIVQGYTNLMRRKKYEFTDDRIRACWECDRHYWKGRTLWCKECVCYVPAAARVTDKECPLDRWPDQKGILKNGR